MDSNASLLQPVPDSDLKLAARIAREAGDLSRKWFRSDHLDVDTKADGSPVTVADRTVERRLRELIEAEDPSAGIVGEEEGVTGGMSDRRWYFDPIDGTQGFVRGVPLYSTLVALHDEHGPAVGVIYLPALDEIVVAGRGRGCTFNDAPCAVSARTDLKGSFITTSAYEDWPAQAFSDLIGAGAILKGWGDGYGYALVATGRVEAMIDPITSPWDVAPMSVIIPEAGGTFSSLSGGDALADGHAIGTNGHLHETVMAAFKRLA
jgi:histidinol-phosphatase